MKKVQKIIIIIYLILVAIACIYVPWKIDYVVENHFEFTYVEGQDTAYIYSFLWTTTPSLRNLEARLTPNEKVNIKQTTIELWKIPLELIALTAIFGVLFVLTLGPKKD
jgi:hypothetical protein